MFYRVTACLMAAFLTGCVGASETATGGRNQLFGYPATPVTPEPVVTQAPLPAPQPREVERGIAARRAAPVAAAPAEPVSVSAVSSIYDDSKDPAVTAVLLPKGSERTVDGVYRRGRDGKIVLPAPATIPIIETTSSHNVLMEGARSDSTVQASETPTTTASIDTGSPLPEPQSR